MPPTPTVNWSHQAGFAHQRVVGALLATCVAGSLGGCSSLIPSILLPGRAAPVPQQTADSTTALSARACATRIQLALTRISELRGNVEDCQAALDEGRRIGFAQPRVLIPFGANSSRVALDDIAKSELVRLSTAASTVEIRSLAVSSGGSTTQHQLAQRRAEEVAALLVSLEVPRNKLRITWQRDADFRGANTQLPPEFHRVELIFESEPPTFTSFVNLAPQDQGTGKSSRTDSRSVSRGAPNSR
jgi:hypothetical protein